MSSGGFTYFKVEMRTATSTGVAAIGHQLSFAYRQLPFGEVLDDGKRLLAVLFLANQPSGLAGKAVEVHIYASVAIGMPDVQYFATTPRGYTNAADVPVGDSVYGFVHGTAGAHVESTVEVSSAAFGKGGGEGYITF